MIKLKRTSINIYPYRITEAREVRKFNISQLAEQIGLTRQAVSRYENGLANPSDGVISKIAECLDFPEGFFYKPSNNDILEGAVFFRTFKSSEVAERRMLEIKLKWIGEAYRFLNDSLYMPTLNLPTIDLMLNKPNFANSDFEEIAGLVRRHWELGDGPIDNLAYTMEKNGIILSGVEIDSDKTDACSIISDGKPIVLYNKKLRSASRIRFSLAHELGHVLLHSHITPEDLKDKKVLDNIEFEANYFAGAFLMPSNTFRNDVHSYNLQSFLLLKDKWRVSIAAMLYRCKNLEIIDEELFSLLFRQLSFKRWRKVEPLDDRIPIELPKLLKNALEYLINKKAVSFQQIKGSFLWNTKDLTDIFCVPDSFFEKDTDMTPYLSLIK